MRGHVVALAVLAVDVILEGEADNLAGAIPHAEGRSRILNWDPKVDGGVNPAVVDFFRELFLLGRAAHKNALTVAGASRKLRHKVPQALMDRVSNVIAKGDQDASSGSDISDNEEQALQKRQKLTADARAIGNTGLVDAGGAAGESRRHRALLRLIPSIPSTATTTSQVVEFARAVVVDPVVVWAPGGNWAGVPALVEALSADPFVPSALHEVMRIKLVKDMRLLHGAVGALYPVMCAQARVRDVFFNLLVALCETNERYEGFVAADTDTSLERCVDGQVVITCAERMAAADESVAFHPLECAKSWLEPPASAERFMSMYGQRTLDASDFLLSGQWAASFPPVRAVPDFLAVGGSPDDVPECNYIMGQENQFTGGMFSASCTCPRPKTIGVVVLDGSEGQRMPIEFAAQRMQTWPSAMVYDFSCASLKTALARLPYLALIIAFLVDRFHWFKNYVWCSKAMNPDSYANVDGQNTSASEERNAASRQLQNFLRLVK